MTIKQIYNLTLEMGIAADPRGKKGIEKWLEREKKKYNKLSRDERECFDKERLTNPCADTRIHYGDPAKSLKTILIGVDSEAGEIALIKALNKNTDLIINHHPEGKVLRKVPKHKIASLNNAGPRIFAGVSENRRGKVVALDITGGTEGAKETYPELVKAGVGTVIGMHMKGENREEALEHYLNVAIAGHISSDSIGMNLFLDRLAAKGIKIIPISGLIRVRRK